MNTMRRQQGLGLVEVMVAALITAIGILGYAGMQVQSLSEATNAQNRMQALALAGDLVSRVRANADKRTSYIDADYRPTSYSPDIGTCFNINCNQDQLFNADVNLMRHHLGSLLPSASLDIAQIAGSSNLMVRVAWNGQMPNAASCDVPVLSGANQFETRCVSLDVAVWED